ncbi:hypothetical protein [uncultured Duncaniella sp.]|nr:hypothetical protein [uncultured Duncaniella sp.]
MTITDGRPVFRAMKCLVIFDYQDGPLKRRQFHKVLHRWRVGV